MNKMKTTKQQLEVRQLGPPGRNHTVEVLKSPDPSQPVNKTETNKNTIDHLAPISLSTIDGQIGRVV